MMEMRLSLADGDWLIGEPVSVLLPATHASEQITVPRDALVFRDDKAYVFKIDADTVARRIEINIGQGSGKRIAVDGAVQAGDRVVVRGAENLRPDQTVNLIERSFSSR
jgi:multidrug efflux pump subunit AcrA (membrane-fusion protein)